MVDGIEVPVSVTAYELEGTLVGAELDEAYVLVETINDVIQVIVGSEGFVEE